MNDTIPFFCPVREQKVKRDGKQDLTLKGLELIKIASLG